MFYICFELFEYVDIFFDIFFVCIVEVDWLWLDDFGSGLVNFILFISWCYEYIKVVRDLFIVL